MLTSDLSIGQVTALLAEGRLALRTGPFLFRIRSSIPAISRGLTRLYARHTVEVDPPFSDFHVSLERSGGVRYLFRPQVRFLLDEWTPFKPLPLTQAFAMLEWGMNWCIANHAHHYLVLHAALVAKGDRALLLPGAPGSGKSTLCAALVQRGWRLFSDELALFDPATAEVVAVPRAVGLKNRSIEVIRHFAPAARIGPVARDTAKGSVAHMAVPEGQEEGGAPARVRWIVFPAFTEGAEEQIEPVTPARTMLELIEHAFNYSVLGERGFNLLGRVVQEAEGFRCTYGELEQVVERMEALAAK